MHVVKAREIVPSSPLVSNCKPALPAVNCI